MIQRFETCAALIGRGSEDRAVILKCYLDDSKREGLVSVCAGFIGSKASWDDLTSAWNACLLSRRIDYYKSSDYKMLSGPFHQFRAFPKPDGRAAALAIKNELQEIIRAQKGRIVGFAVSVDVKAYKKVILRPEANGLINPEPYRPALQTVFERIARRIRVDLKGRDMVAFVHDDEDDSNALTAVYKAFRKKNPKSAKMIAGLSFADDKTIPALQAADMMANDIQANTVRYLTAGQLPVTDCELHENLSSAGVWTEEFMLNVLKRQLIIAKRPIPPDLIDLVG